ncbi:MAG: insulinase family protein, partial [Acidobacteriota bacterium]
KGAAERQKIEPTRPLEKGVEIDVEMDVSKAYLVIAALAPDYNHADQHAMDILTEILGRGVNPMLYSALMNPRRLIQTVSMAYHSLQYGGIVLIYLTLDPKNLGSVKREALSFLRKARDQNFSPDDVYGELQMYAYDYLRFAKNQIKYNAYQSQEKGLALAVSIARFMLVSEGSTPRNYLKSIDEVKSGDLRKAAAKYFSRSPYVLISIVPKKTN